MCMDKDELVRILKEQQIAVLSNVDANNNVHGSTMFFVVDEFLNFYLLTKSNTRKHENIKSNNNVALTVIFLKEQKTVQAEGTIEEVSAGTEQYRTIISEFAVKNAEQDDISWPPPLAKLPDAGLIIHRITPNWLRYGDYSKYDQEVYQQVIPSELVS